MPCSHLAVIFLRLDPGPGMGAEGFSLARVQPRCGVFKAVCWGEQAMYPKYPGEINYAKCTFGFGCLSKEIQDS